VPFKEQLNSQSALIYINSLPLGTQIMVEIYLGDGANLVEAIRLAPQNHRVGVFSSAAHCGMPFGGSRYPGQDELVFMDGDFLRTIAYHGWRNCCN